MVVTAAIRKRHIYATLTLYVCIIFSSRILCNEWYHRSSLKPSPRLDSGDIDRLVIAFVNTDQATPRRHSSLSVPKCPLFYRILKLPLNPTPSVPEASRSRHAVDPKRKLAQCM